MSTRRWPPPGASSWATATFFSPGLASPSSTRRSSAGAASDSPSNNPTTRVSAEVSSGAPAACRDLDLLSRASTLCDARKCPDTVGCAPRVHEGDRLDAQDRDPRRRPHALREDGRRPGLARRHRPRRHGDRGRARARRGGSRAGRARGLRPGAAGRPGPDPVAARPRSRAGIPKEVSSETVNKVCASGLRSAGIVDQAVRAGDLDLAVAGGMESMSNAPVPASSRLASATAWATPRRSTR